MTAPQTANPDFRQPAWNSPVDDGLDYIRQNARFIMLCAMSEPPPAGYAVLPGWQTHVDISSSGSYATPDKWVLTKGTMRIEARFTWDGSALSTVQVCFDNGVEGGLVCFPPAFAGTSTGVLWDDTPITVEGINPDGSAYPEIEFTDDASELGYSFAMFTQFINPRLGAVNATVPLISGSFGAGEFLFKYEEVSTIEGSPAVLVNEAAGVAGQWYDLNEAFLSVWDESVASPNIGDHIILDVTVAMSDGNGSPVEGTEQTKRVTFVAYRGDYEYLVKDHFVQSGENDSLTSHSPDVGGSWSVQSGTWILDDSGASGWAECDGEGIAYISTGSANFAVKARVGAIDVPVGLIGRREGPADYWELRVVDADTASPTLQLIDVDSSTSPQGTVVASKTLTGEGPLISYYLRLMFNGNDIVGEWGAPLYSKGLHRIEHTSANHNAATAAGMHSLSEYNRFFEFDVTDMEIGRVI